MIPILKPEDYIGMGFAVWDEKNEVARKYICTAVDCRVYGASGLADGDDCIYVMVYGVRLYEGKVNSRCWYDATDCYANKTECMLASLDRAIADNADNPERQRHFMEMKAAKMKKLEMNRFYRKVRKTARKSRTGD